MVQRTLGKAVLLVFGDSTFEEQEVLKALDVILVATESAGSRSGTCLLRVTSSFYQQILMAAGVDFGYLGAVVTAWQVEVLFFTKSIL